MTKENIQKLLIEFVNENGLSLNENRVVNGVNIDFMVSYKGYLILVVHGFEKEFTKSNLEEVLAQFRNRKAINDKSLQFLFFNRQGLHSLSLINRAYPFDEELCAQRTQVITDIDAYFIRIKKMSLDVRDRISE